MSKTVLFKEVEVFDIFRLDGELLIRYNTAVAGTIANCKVIDQDGKATRWKRVENNEMVELSNEDIIKDQKLN